MRKLLIAVCLLMITSAFEPKAKAPTMIEPMATIEPAQMLDTLANRINYLNQVKARNEKR